MMKMVGTIMVYMKRLRLIIIHKDIMLMDWIKMDMQKEKDHLDQRMNGWIKMDLIKKEFI